MKNLFILSLIIFLFACNTNQNIDKESLKKEVFETEKAFEKMLADEGIAKAFEHFADDSGVVKRGNYLLKGKKEIFEHYNAWTLKDLKLNWTADFVDVANSGDIAYTYGKAFYSYRDSLDALHNDTGVFHTVWKKQKNGTWRFVWD